MNYSFDWHAVFLFIAAAVYIYSIFKLWDHRERMVVRTFISLLISAAWWLACMGMEHLSIRLAEKSFWMYMTYFGIVLAAPLWFIFTLHFTESPLSSMSRRKFIPLFIVPAAVLILVWTNSWHHLVWTKIWLDTSYSPAEDMVVHGIAWYVMAVYSWSLLVVSIVQYVRFLRRSPGVNRVQVALLILGVSVPWLMNIGYAVDIFPLGSFDPTGIFFAVTGVIFYWGLSRLQLLDIIPLAYREAFNITPDGVLVTDRRGRVAIINAAACNLLGLKRADVLGKDISTRWPPQFNTIGSAGQNSRARTLVTLGEGQNRRHIGVHSTPLTSRQRFSGHVIILHDDTQAALQSITDDLTGLYNYRHFGKMLEQEIARSRRLDKVFTLMILDLDNFKQYNDSCGHPAGDVLLHNIGGSLGMSMRSFDNAFRYGGDEFVVILPETGLKDAVLAAERIKKNVEQICPENIGASFGLAAWPQNGDTGQDLISRADAALYRAKQGGKNRICAAETSAANLDS
jgi:diguanylate cyclase (GGDEF)-like protein/PAS domain S-box-containing protein